MRRIARDRLTQALSRSNGPETLSDVESDVAGGRAQLWDGMDLTAVTQVNGSDLHVWLMGGSLKGLSDILASAEAWARNIGLSRITVDRARRGWARALQPHGFRTADDVQLAKILEG